VISTFSRPPAVVDPELPYVIALREAAGALGDGTARGIVGRDGASDAVSFLRAGVPAVEFGPVGGGHHGPDEWVSVPSLERYRRSITEFVNELPHKVQRIPAEEDTP
jgi:succinyl-diaminopimelate desuccinylase